MKSRLMDLALLMLRLALGVGLMYHGYGKLERGIDTFADGAVAEMGFPAPMLFAVIGVATELLGGLFIAIGLWTRYCALFAVIMMGVAAFVRNAGEPFSKQESAIAYMVVSLFFLLAGPGQYAVHPGGKASRSKSSAADKKR